MKSNARPVRNTGRMNNRFFFCFILLLGVSFLAKAQHRKEMLKEIDQHKRAVYLKSGWIRDPYIYLCEDGFYYLTGTTPACGDKREADDPYNLGLDHVSRQMGLKPSIVGYQLRVWRSWDLTLWEYIGEPFSLERRYWARKFPDAFRDRNGLLWAPEMYRVDGKWVFVHTSPEPVANGANLVIADYADRNDSFAFPMGDDIRDKHDPSLFRDDDGTWYLTWGSTEIAPLKPGFRGLEAKPVHIGPSDRSIGHEGTTLRKIGKKYVLFGTAWSTDIARKGSYNLYYCTADKITGPYSERRFAGRFLGHGTPFRDKEGRWWCTAFFNGNVPPLPMKGIWNRDLRATAQTINEQGTTIVPLEVKIGSDGDVYISPLDSAYAIPGPDEVQDFHATP